MSHNWDDLDHLLSDIDGETEAEARAFEDTGGSGVLLAELETEDGPFPAPKTTWPQLTPEAFERAATVISQALQPVVTEWAKAVVGVASEMQLFLEAAGFRLSANGRRMPTSQPKKQPFPTRKGPRPEQKWCRV